MKLKESMFSSPTYCAKYNWIDDGYKTLPTFTAYDTKGVLTEKQPMYSNNFYINKKIVDYLKPDVMYQVCRMSRSDYTYWGLKKSSNGTMYEYYGKTTLDHFSALLELDDKYYYATNWTGVFYFYDINPELQPFVSIANPELIFSYTITEDTDIVVNKTDTSPHNTLYHIVVPGAEKILNANVIIPECYCKGYTTETASNWATKEFLIIQYGNWSQGRNVSIRDINYVNDIEGFKKHMIGKTIYFRASATATADLDWDEEEFIAEDPSDTIKSKVSKVEESNK